jgi:hypothetical protein
MNENAPRWDEEPRNINGKDKIEGSDMQINPPAFPDKKKPTVLYDRITQHIEDAQKIRSEMEIGQERGTWRVDGDYKTLPVLIVYMTDVHYGAIGTDYQTLNRHFDIVENTPNTFLVMGGDTIDNFAIKHAHAGIMGDAIPPQVQAQAFMEKLLELDRKSKLGAICYGNHEDWVGIAGLDYYQTFMSDISAPIFTKGGMLHALVQGQEYRIGITHKFWGTSKKNISNAPKNALEFGFPDAEIMLTGDDHQSSAEIFDRGGKRMLVVDGGTYKTLDTTGSKWGLGHAGRSGYGIFLWPDNHRFEIFADVDSAKQIMDSLIALKR